MMKLTVQLFFLMLFIIEGCSDNKQVLDTATVASDFCLSIHRNDTTFLSAELAPIEDSMKTKTGVYVLEDGGTSLISRAWLSEYAEKSIDIQYFIFSTDNVGLIAVDYLVRAADRGIKVRILLDDIMVEAKAEEILKLDSHPNIEIRIYNPALNLGKNFIDKYVKLSTDFAGANQRMHNKTFIVDGKVAITGGRNIADEYFDYDHEYNFRDRDVILFGKAVDGMCSSFNLFWNDTLSMPVKTLVSSNDSTLDDATRFDKLHQYACDSNNFWPQVRQSIKKLPEAFKLIQKSGELVWLDSVYFISDLPGKNRFGSGSITKASLAQLVVNAKSTIDIQSPYLIVTETGRKLFKEAIQRGVKVRILTNSMASTDNLEAFGGYQKCRQDLLEIGVRIYEFKPDAKCRYDIMTGALQKQVNYKPVFGLHAKTMVVDGRVSVVGTFNLDPRSANLNTECFATIYSKKIAGGILKGMETEFLPENSWETTKKFNPDIFGGAEKNKKMKFKKLVPVEIL